MFAAQLQLQELQAQLQCRADAKTAMAVYLQHSNDAHEQIGDQQHDSMDSSIPLDDWETCQLQEQIAALTLLVNTHDSQKVAASLQAQEEANNAAIKASLQVADRLAEQESWHKRIIDHDAEFARSLAFCDSEEWEANGDNLESPLQLGPRPSSPGRCRAVAVVSLGVSLLSAYNEYLAKRFEANLWSVVASPLSVFIHHFSAPELKHVSDT